MVRPSTSSGSLHGSRVNSATARRGSGSGINDDDQRPWTAPTPSVNNNGTGNGNGNDRIPSSWRSPPSTSNGSRNDGDNRFNLFDAATGLTFTSIRATTPIISIAEGTYRAGALSSHDHRFIPPSPDGMRTPIHASCVV
jgi:hypothetical protein